MCKERTIRPLLTQSGDDPESPKERTQRGQPLEKSDSLAEFLFRPLRVLSLHSSGTTPSHLRRGQSVLSLHRKNSRKPRGKIPVSPATDYATFSNSRHVASHAASGEAEAAFGLKFPGTHCQVMVQRGVVNFLHTSSNHCRNSLVLGRKPKQPREQVRTLPLGRKAFKTQSKTMEKNISVC